MSDHFDLLDFAAPDPAVAALDVTGLYAFRSPDDSTRSVLVLAVNPFAIAPAFDPTAVYRIEIDLDGDLLADLAFSVMFAPAPGGGQVATVFRADGFAAQEPGPTGSPILAGVVVSTGDGVVIAEGDGYRFFAGPRSDPFFADAEGLFNGYAFTGTDAFGDKDVFAIVLEVPNELLGAGPVAIWGRTLAEDGGAFVQADRTGGANLLNFLTYGSQDEVGPYRASPPSEDRARFAGRYTAILESAGYPGHEAAAVVERLLPDVLVYDHRVEGGFPNGRRLTDDLADLAVSLITRGRVTGDGIGPHRDLVATFPHLGAPHRRQTGIDGVSLRDSTPADTGALYSLWRRSVEATHDFLDPADLERLSAIVRDEYLPSTTLLVAVGPDDVPIGFLGGDGDTIDSLFVDPDWHRRGIGAALTGAAFRRSPVTRLEVNEANHGARAFYRRMGFVEIGRSETDDYGLPYPLLQLERRSA